MTDRIPIAQRALELAVTGEFEKLRDIKRQLKAERYEQIDSHLQGSLGKQVSAKAKVAWGCRIDDQNDGASAMAHAFS